MKIYFTFGQDHIHKLGGTVLDKNCVLVVDADSEDAARKSFIKRFGTKFCVAYPESTWDKLGYEQVFPRGLIHGDLDANMIYGDLVEAKRIVYLCRDCWSTEIDAEKYYRWDISTQTWVTGDDSVDENNMSCSNCGGTSITTVEV